MDHLLSVRKRVLEGIVSVDAVKEALEGHLDRAFYVAYLCNAFHYTQHSATVTAMAGARAVQRHPDLSRYLFHHAGEELRHEEWALDDLGSLGMAAEAVRISRPVPACAAMIGYEYYVAAHANPIGLFGWLYTLETMGEDLGGRLAVVLAGMLGDSEGSGVKFLSGHGIAYHEHTADLTHVISTYVNDPNDQADVNHVADVVADLYVRMFQQIAESAC